MTQSQPQADAILAENKEIAAKLSILSSQMVALCDVIERVVQTEEGLRLEEQIVALAKSVRFHAVAVDDLSTFLTN